MKPPAFLIPGLALCVVVAAGCSSSDGSAASTAGATTSVRAEYKRAFERADRELTNLVESGSDGVATAKQRADEMRADAAGYERIADELEALLPPDAVRGEHESLVKGLRDGAHGLRGAAQVVEVGGDPSKDKELMALANRLFAAWDALRAATK